MTRPVAAVVESNVMGRAAVLNLATWLGLCGIAEVLGFPTSTAISRVSMSLALAWSACWVVGAAMSWAGRFQREARNARVLEVGGIWALNLGLLTYAVVVVVTSPRGIDGKVVVLALVLSAATSLSGRCTFLLRQAWFIRQARRTQATQ